MPRLPYTQQLQIRIDPFSFRNAGGPFTVSGVYANHLVYRNKPFKLLLKSCVQNCEKCFNFFHSCTVYTLQDFLSQLLLSKMLCRSWRALSAALSRQINSIMPNNFT